MTALIFGPAGAAFRKLTNKQFCIGCGVCWFIMAMIMVILIIDGLDQVEYVEDYTDNSTAEQCEIVDVWIEDICDCSKTSDTCNGRAYGYEVVVQDKCGNITIFEDDAFSIGCTSIGSNKVLNESYDCWVYECEAFSFKSIDNSLDAAKTQIIGCSVALGIAACIVFGFCCYGLLHLMKQKGIDITYKQVAITTMSEK